MVDRKQSWDWLQCFVTEPCNINLGLSLTPTASLQQIEMFGIVTQAAAAAAKRSGLPGVRGLATISGLPDLPYDYGALQPVISGQIMELHHKKHHQAYITNYNTAIKQYAEAESKGDIGTMIKVQPAIKFNGGGHINHSIFWTNLAPTKECEPPSGELLQLINSRWKSLDAFVAAFNGQTAAVQGSGWGWLGYNKATGALEIATTANQDPLLPTTGLVPLLGVDVWEHAYYLDYKNARPDYLKAVWQVVNWKNVADRLAQAKK